MPSDVQKRFSDSVVIKYSNPEHIEKAVGKYVQNLRRKNKEIERVIWFGSWVNGIPSPGSDVDLCLILSYSDTPFRERIPDYLPVGFPVGLDIFPYTRDEFESLKRNARGLYESIVSGREL